MQEDVSELLIKWQGGDRHALSQLMPIVYSELRRIGRGHLSRRPNHSVLQPTVLVHEAWVCLVRRQDGHFEGRSQFYALASRIMRDVLVDYCRRARAAKRGGSQIEIVLEDANVAHNPRMFDLLVLDDALTRLGQIKPRYVQIVESRFFGGLTIEETADALEVSTATIEREWNFARSWLRRDLRSERANDVH